MLDYEWSSNQHLTEAKAKATRRFSVLTKVGNAAWGMERRILSITAHSLVESVISYGLATAGTRWEERGAGQIDRAVINKTARKVIGTNMTIRIETLMMLADMRNAMNHYLLKTANILDRVLRASGPTARKTSLAIVREKYEEWEENEEKEELPDMIALDTKLKTPEKIISSKEGNRHGKKQVGKETKQSAQSATMSLTGSKGG